MESDKMNDVLNETESKMKKAIETMEKTFYKC